MAKAAHRRTRGSARPASQGQKPLAFGTSSVLRLEGKTRRGISRLVQGLRSQIRVEPASAITRGGPARWLIRASRQHSAQDLPRGEAGARRLEPAVGGGFHTQGATDAPKAGAAHLDLDTHAHTSTRTIMPGSPQTCNLRQRSW
jgi:hypothetical protein